MKTKKAKQTANPTLSEHQIKIEEGVREQYALFVEDYPKNRELVLVGILTKELKPRRIREQKSFSLC